jgi:hypothetical protein
MIPDEIVEEIKHRVHEHHRLYDLTIKGEYWEEIFAKSIIATGGVSDWSAERTHTIGLDQICSWSTYDNKRVSNKSGLYTISTDTLKINGSRSTSFNTLEEKVKYFSDKQEDVYMCLATSSLKKDNNYYLFSFESKILNYSEANWIPHVNKEGKEAGWKCETDVYKAWIKLNMSDQLWTHINIKNANISPIIIER